MNYVYNVLRRKMCYNNIKKRRREEKYIVVIFLNFVRNYLMYLKEDGDELKMCIASSRTITEHIKQRGTGNKPRKEIKMKT